MRATSRRLRTGRHQTLRARNGAAMPHRRERLASMAALALAGSASQAHAETWPQRPVRLIVPFAAGGNTDGIARIAAQRLSEALGEQFVIENRPGAGGAIAAELVAKATP